MPAILILQIIHPILNVVSSSLTSSNFYMSLLALALFLYLAIKVPGSDNRQRPTSFFSSLLNRRVVYGYNHMSYTFLMLLLVLTGWFNLIII